MFTRIAAVALAFAVSPAAASARQPADPPLPPIVFQVQPAGQVLESFRTAAAVVGGDRAVKAFDKTLKDTFGDKGIEGLDINRPIVGYVILAPKPTDITAVVALPVTSEKDFIALCDRLNRDPVRADGKDKSLYHLTPLQPQYEAVMRFSNQYAYIVYGANPYPHAAPGALVPMHKLYDPAERGLAAARLHFDRIPLAVKLAAPAMFEELKKSALAGARPGPGNEALVTPIVAEVEKLVTRYAVLAAGADVLTARAYFDHDNATFVAEAALTAKAGTELAKTVAAYKTAPNRFATLAAHPDTVAALHTRLPLVAPELRTAAALGFDVAGKEEAQNARDVDRAWKAELYKGLGRTAKNKDWDVAVTFRGPDKDGWYSVLGVTAFDDATQLEKEAIESWKKDAPKEEQDRMKWNADSFGKVNIHTYHWKTGGFIDFTRVLGGEKCYGAFAFAPDGIVGVIGPDPVPLLKEALAAKPAPAPAFELVLNPARVVKALEKMNEGNDLKAQKIAELLGREDKILSCVKVDVTGGAELKATLTLNLKQLPRLVLMDAIDRGNRGPDGPPPPKPPLPDFKN